MNADKGQYRPRASLREGGLFLSATPRLRVRIF